MSAGWPPPPEPLPLPVVDDHCHLDIPAAARDEAAEERSLDVALANAAAVNVPRAIQVGYDVASSRWSVEAATSHPQLLAGVALHPNEAPRLAARGALASAYAEIEALASHPRVRVIGETGLDTFRTGPEGAAAQEESFRWHIDLAKRTGRALQIHDRDAHADVLRILAEEGAPERTVLHCFSGDADLARECVRRGYVLSIAGTVTFTNAGALREGSRLATPGFEDCRFDERGEYLWAVGSRNDREIEVQLIDTSDWSVAMNAVLEDRFLRASSATLSGTSRTGLISLWIAAGQDGQEVYWLKHNDRTFNCEHVKPLTNTTPPTFSVDGSEFLALNANDAICKYDFASMKQIGSLLELNDENDSFGFSLCYFNDGRAIAGTNNGRIYLIGTDQMKVVEEVEVEGHEPRPIGVYYPALAGESGLATDISWFTRLEMRLFSFIGATVAKTRKVGRTRSCGTG